MNDLNRQSRYVEVDGTGSEEAYCFDALAPAILTKKILLGMWTVTFGRHERRIVFLVVGGVVEEVCVYILFEQIEQPTEWPSNQRWVGYTNHTVQVCSKFPTT